MARCLHRRVRNPRTCCTHTPAPPQPPSARSGAHPCHRGGVQQHHVQLRPVLCRPGELLAPGAQAPGATVGTGTPPRLAVGSIVHHLDGLAQGQCLPSASPAAAGPAWPHPSMLACLLIRAPHPPLLARPPPCSSTTACPPARPPAPAALQGQLICAIAEYQRKVCPCPPF